MAGGKTLTSSYPTIPMMSRSDSIPSFSISTGRASTIALHAKGFLRFSAPTWTAEAPAIIIYMTSAALATPPQPMTGIEQA